MATPEERIYRHRCVEGWSIVVPWIGFSLSELIKRADPLPKAKYVQFTTLLDPAQMPGQRSGVLLLALCRRPAHGRSDAPAGVVVLWHVWRSTAQPERCAVAHRTSLEVWFQERRKPSCVSASSRKSLSTPGVKPRRLTMGSTPT